MDRRIWIAAIAACIAAPCLAQRDDPIVIGQTYISSGPIAGFSPGPMLGIKALVASVNKAGGVHGRIIVVKQVDDAGTSDKAEANVRELAQQGAAAILMPIGTLPAIAATKAGGELGIPIVAPYTGAGPLYAGGSTVFPLRISFAEEVRRIVEHTALIGQSRVAAVYIDNPGAKMPVDAARHALQAQGSGLVGEFALAQDSSDALTKAKQLYALRPQSVILSVSNPVAASFIKAYRALGGTSQFYATSFLNGVQLYKDIGEAANGVVIMQVVPSPKSPIRLAAEYRAAMAAIGAAGDLSYPSFEGYIAAKALIEALRKLPPSAIKPANVQAALRSMTAYDLGGITASFKETGRGALNYGELSMVRRDGFVVR